MDKRVLLSQSKIFVLDLDGTFYMGSQIIESSLDFLQNTERK